MYRPPRPGLVSRAARALLVTAWLSVLPCGCVQGCGGGDPGFQAMAGEGGVALLFSGLELEDGVVEAVSGGVVQRTLEVGDADVVVDPLGEPDTEYRLLDAGGDRVATAVPRTLTIRAESPPPPIVDPGHGVWLELSFEDHELRLGEGELLVWRQQAPDGARQFLEEDCSSGDGPECWEEEPVPYRAAVQTDQLVTLGIGFDPIIEGIAPPATLDTGLFFRITDPVTGDAVLAGSGLRLVALETALRWGDPHAHTNLSHDGCEDVDAGCGNRGALPGGDFFSNAVAADLDFTAITDHAEWDEILVAEGDAVPVWATTQQLVAAAEAAYTPDFIPLLGFEWTHYVPVHAVVEPGEDPGPHADEFTAGHMTVLLDATAACDAYRVAAPTGTPTYPKGDSGLEYVQLGLHPVVDKPMALFEQLDDAGQQCGAVGALTFFHHSANLMPNPVSWALAINEPDDHYERLVEIVSEHGSSECRDITDDGCEFRLNDGLNNFHVQWGAVQEALSQGYRLGFVGGGDSHDGRPGSLDDGPSWLALYNDLDGDGVMEGPIQHSFDGALTGVWSGAEWSRAALWEALAARRTLATTGPRGDIAAAAVGADGTPYLPGEETPASGFPIQVRALLELDDGWTVTRLELVEPDGGTVVASVEDSPQLVAEVEDPGSPALYLRARVDGADGGEHRVWISPWFIDRER